jgi:sensor histidine kinase YesM
MDWVHALAGFGIISSIQAITMLTLWLVFRSSSYLYYLQYLLVVLVFIFSIGLLHYRVIDELAFYYLSLVLGVLAYFSYLRFYRINIGLNELRPDIRERADRLYLWFFALFVLACLIDFFTHHRITSLAFGFLFLIGISFLLNFLIKGRNIPVFQRMLTVSAMVSLTLTFIWLTFYANKLDRSAINNKFLFIVFLPYVNIEFFMYNVAAWMRQKYAADLYEQMQHMETYRNLNDLKLRDHLLASRLNPHTISNILNRIQHAVAFKNPEKAMSIIHQYSGYLSRVMKSYEKSEHSLQDEAEVIEQYLRIAREQLGDNLSFAFTIAADPATIIPAMIFVPLVENAIIHGGRPSDEGMSHILVNFRMEQNVLIMEVLDNGPGPGSQVNNNNTIAGGYGLKNVRERLQLLEAQKNCRASLIVDNAVQPAFQKGCRARIEIKFNSIS